MKLRHDVNDRNHSLVVPEREAPHGRKTCCAKDEWGFNETRDAFLAIRYFCYLVVKQNIILSGRVVLNVLDVLDFSYFRVRLGCRIMLAGHFKE